MIPLPAERALRRPHLTVPAAALLAAAAALLVFIPALRNDFAYDDVAVVLNDTRVHGLDSIPAIFGAGYWQDDAALSLWRPVTTLSFALDWSVRGPDPAWFHGVNIAWHALATALLTVLLARLFGALSALLGGLLFAIHPVHVEAVANVVGRAELIAAAAAFAAALLWLPARHGPARIAGTAVLFLVALGAKESAIMLPALLVLLDAASGVLRRGSLRPWLLGRAPGLILLAAAAAAYVLLRVQVLGGFLPTRIDPALDLTPDAPGRVFTALQVWPHVLRLFFFPRTLLADYGPRILLPRPVPDALVLTGAAIILGLVLGGLVALVRGRGALALLLLWVPVAMLPVSNLFFPIGVLLAERTLYLPSAALAIGVALATPLVRVRGRAAAHAALAAALVAGVLLTAGALRRIPEWRTTDTVFVALLRDRPDSFYAHWHLGRAAVRRGDAAAGLASYGRALTLWPYRQRLIIEAAGQAMSAGDTAFAARIIEHGARAWPRSLDIRRMAASVALDRGDSIAAARELAAGLAIDSTDETLRRMRAALGGRAP